MSHIDDIDKKILALLGRNSRVSLNQLSQQVFLTPPAVAARIEKLERSGLITGYRTDLDLEKMGYPITAFIEITMEPDVQRDFFDFIQEKRNVLECYHVTGAYSMLLKVCFPAPSHLDQFVSSLQTFGKTQTQIVFSTVISPRPLCLD